MMVIIVLLLYYIFNVTIAEIKISATLVCVFFVSKRIFSTKNFIWQFLDNR